MSIVVILQYYPLKIMKFTIVYLKRFPVQTLKIAREFIQDITNFQNRAIVTTIITMGKHLQLNVIAEGVETEEQLTFLKGLNCDEMQGFLYSKPLPKNEFEGFFKDSEKRRLLNKQA
jgi:diguanylate cyclase